MDAVSAESRGELAPRSVDEAKREVALLDEHVRAQQQRWRLFQRWDAERCRSGTAKLEQARADVTAARATRDQALALESGATALLEEAARTMAGVAAFLDAGVVRPELAERVGGARGAMATAQGKLALTLGELRGAGFMGPLDPLRRVDAEIHEAMRSLDDVAAAATRQAVTVCRPKLGASTPTFTTAPRVLNDWLAWRGEVGQRSALFVFRLDRARHGCRQTAARADDTAVALDQLEGARIWHAAGRVPTQILFVFGPQGAWFAPSAGGLSAFSHDRAARFVRACHGKVTCDAPEVGATTVEATCSCAYGDLELAIGDRSRRVRYLWDGRAVRAEL